MYIFIVYVVCMLCHIVACAVIYVSLYMCGIMAIFSRVQEYDYKIKSIQIYKPT